MRIHRNILYSISDDIKEPLTVGVIKPILLIPGQQFHKNERIRYGTLILDMLTERKTLSPLFVESFSSNQKRVEERIISMINAKKKKRGSQVLAGCLLLVLGVTSSMTVLVYEWPTIITEQSKDEIFENNSIHPYESLFIADNISSEDIENADPSLRTFITTSTLEVLPDYYFKDGEGNIYEMEPPIIQKDCAHTYVSGTSSEHIKSGSS